MNTPMYVDIGIGENLEQASLVQQENVFLKPTSKPKTSGLMAIPSKKQSSLMISTFRESVWGITLRSGRIVTHAPER